MTSDSVIILVMFATLLDMKEHLKIKIASTWLSKFAYIVAGLCAITHIIKLATGA